MSAGVFYLSLLEQSNNETKQTKCARTFLQPTMEQNGIIANSRNIWTSFQPTIKQNRINVSPWK
jgi:hypothetical protein